LQGLSQRHALLRRDGERWAFEPPLLAQHLVATLTPERRRREHETLAAALVELGSDDAAAIGAHLFHAGLEAQALPELERAARAALERHDAESALASLDLACPAADRTLASEADAARRIELGLLRTRALQGLAAWDAAAAELDNLLVLSRAWGQDGAEMQLRAQGEVEYGRSRFDAAIACWLEAQACAARAGDAHELHELALKIGNIHFERGELEQAAAEYERTLAFATTSGDIELEARAANNVALVESIQGRKQRAVQFFNRSLERFRSLGRNDAVARLDQNIGQIYLELGNWAEARNFFQRAMEESEASGQQSLLAVACLDCAEANFRLGARAEAATAVERALAISRECGDDRHRQRHRLQASLAAAASIPPRRKRGCSSIALAAPDTAAARRPEGTRERRLQAGRPGPARGAGGGAAGVRVADAPQHAAEVVLANAMWTVPACPP
jgi:tetratricopeptide (TPR) repeat protein